MSDSAPFNDTLARQQHVVAGDTVRCPSCGEQHRLLDPDDGPSRAGILFYWCGEKVYLGAVGYRLVVDVPADLSGEV